MFADDLLLANERLSRFAIDLSHDLHQPLFALGGYLELLHTVPSLESEPRKWITRALTIHHELVSAVDDLRRGTVTPEMSLSLGHINSSGRTGGKVRLRPGQ
jgi:signal transduction histidine kinase